MLDLVTKAYEVTRYYLDQKGVAYKSLTIEEDALDTEKFEFYPMVELTENKQKQRLILPFDLLMEEDWEKEVDDFIADHDLIAGEWPS